MAFARLFVTETAVGSRGLCLLLGTTRQALVVKCVQVEGVSARRTAELAGTAAGATGAVARPALLGRWIVVLGA